MITPGMKLKFKSRVTDIFWSDYGRKLYSFYKHELYSGNVYEVLHCSQYTKEDGTSESIVKVTVGMVPIWVSQSCFEIIPKRNLPEWF